MSSNFWQTKKQAKLYKHGNTVISKVNAYVTTWMNRCYSGGIPDELPEALAHSLYAPCYKKIASCLLKNDLLLKGLGFEGKESEYYCQIKREKKKREQPQIDMF